MPHRVRELACGLAATAALATAAAAQGAPPTKEDQSPLHVSFPAGALCEFPVSWDSVAFDAFTITHVDADGNVRWIFGGGRNVIRVTNDATGESLDVNASGPGKITFDPDGTLRITGGGPWLGGFLPGDSPPSELLLTSGRLVVTIDPTSGRVTLVSLSGSTRDICAELA